MTEPFIGEIQLFGFSYAPAYWAFANGQTVPIRQSTTLYALIGTLYGGDGVTTFQLPNLVSRQACGSGQGPGLTQRSLGQTFGQFNVTLDTTQLPMHNHGMNIYPFGDTETPLPASNSGIGVPNNGNLYAAPGTPTTMNAGFVQQSGAGQPHYNCQPYLGLNYSIALFGSYPYFG